MNTRSLADFAVVPKAIPPLPLTSSRDPQTDAAACSFFDPPSCKIDDHCGPEQLAWPRAGMKRACDFNRVMSDLLARLANCPASQLDDELGRTFRGVCEFIEVAGAGLWYRSSSDAESFRLTHLFPAAEVLLAPGSDRSAGKVQESLVSSLKAGVAAEEWFPWTTIQVKSGNRILFSSLSELPAEAEPDRQALARLQIASGVVIPFFLAGRVIGAASFGFEGEQPQWPLALARWLVMVSQILGNVLARKFAEEAVLKARESISSSDAALKASLKEVLDLKTAFRMVADSAPVLIWMSGLDKQCNFFNQPWLDFRGRRPEQEIGNGWAEGVHPEDLADCLQTYVTKFDAREPFVMKYRLRRHDGEYRWVLDRGVPRYETDGSFVGYIGSCVDITEQKLAEEALLKSYAEIKELKDRLQAETDYLREEIKVTQSHGEILGNSRGIKEVLHQVELVAPTDSSVLITGETGTGKELIARAIHQASRRKDRVMVTVNCAGLPSALVESELFGRERGAYTGALTRQAGRFEVAHNSTILLDEIGELSLDVQAKLLRVLEAGELERLGSTQTIKVDVRVVAATNRDLAEEVRKGRFREDLYYRLNVFPISIPPLRERLEDIPELAWAFVEQFCKRMGRKIDRIPRKAMDALQQYRWPGNVRQLRNAIEHSVIISTESTLRLIIPDNPLPTAPPPRTLAENEREHILRTLETCKWRIKGPGGAAQSLGMKPSTLYTRMRKLAIPIRAEKFRPLQGPKAVGASRLMH